MEKAKEFERTNKREPEDVSDEKRGYDIISRGPDGERYIEVKGTKNWTEVALTKNEWEAARKLREKYHLYIVEVTTGKLCIIQDPYGKAELYGLDKGWRNLADYVDL